MVLNEDNLQKLNYVLNIPPINFNLCTSAFSKFFYFGSSLSNDAPHLSVMKEKSYFNIFRSFRDASATTVPVLG